MHSSTRKTPTLKSGDATYEIRVWCCCCARQDPGAKRLARRKSRRRVAAAPFRTPTPSGARSTERSHVRPLPKRRGAQRLQPCSCSALRRFDVAPLLACPAAFACRAAAEHSGCTQITGRPRPPASRHAQHNRSTRRLRWRLRPSCPWRRNKRRGRHPEIPGWRPPSYPVYPLGPCSH